MRRGLTMIGLCSAAVLAQHPEIPLGGGDRTGGNEGSLIGDGDGGYGYRDMSAHNMEILGWLPPSEFPGAGRSANDCWGYVSPSGREYALLGLRRAFGFIEVTDPLRPEILHVETGPGSTWRDIKVFGHHAYGVSEAALGVEIYDLSRIDEGIVTKVNQITGQGTDSSHNVAIDEVSGYLYRLGGGGDDSGIRMYDLNADPVNPTYVGQWVGDNDVAIYIHDAQAVTYTDGPYAGREFVFACGGPGTGRDDTRLWIIDVTDKADPFFVSSVAYSDRNYAHQGWLSNDRTLFYLDDELDESNRGVPTSTHVIDVSDLDNPLDLGTFTNNSPATDHNLYPKGDFVFEANYRSGLRVFDASVDPTSPVEIAWVDTFRLDDRAGTQGAWSNYPYLPSGTILISDRSQGLVLTRLTLDRIEIDLRLPEFLEPSGSVVEATIAGVDLTPDIDGTRLYYEDANGVVEIEPVSLGGDEYSFGLPPSDCHDTARIWLLAPSVEGAVFGSPVRAPLESHERPVATSAGTPFVDDFESDLGWTVSGDAPSGMWERGTPVVARRGDPPFDSDYSGQCYLTWNIAEDADVDDGSVILTSPTIDASLGGTIEYAYWLNDADDDEGLITSGDGVFVELSTDDGATWTRVREHQSAEPHWNSESVDIDATVGASATLRVRFIAHDDDTPSVVEAGIDAIRYQGYACDACAADLDGDADADADDFFAYLDLFAAGDPGADIDGDGDADADDFFGYLDLFAAGC